jgi:shikimate dehydrogenase
MSARATSNVYAVIGAPVSHSLSPIIHNAAFDAVGVDAIYVALFVQPGCVAAALDAMKTLGIRGFSVTMPHKTDVARLADVCSPDVVALQSANTVTLLADGRLQADSFDGEGCVRALRRAGVEPEGKRCVILGAGGAGRAVALALHRNGADRIGIVNRDDGRADEAIALAGPAGYRGDTHSIGDADIVINATSVGMGTDDSLPCDPSLLHSGQAVNDLVYHPLETPLLRAASAAGATTVNGLGMLLCQAAMQFEQWTGVDAPIAVMEAAVVAELARRG